MAERIRARGLGGIARSAIAVSVAWILIAQPAVVLADVFSATVYEYNATPIGEPNTDYCLRAGVVTTARNYGQILAYTNGGGAHDCIGTMNTLPSGWLAVRVEGYRDGVLCGTSGFSTSSSAATNWQLWSTQCTNPSGLQNFTTRSVGNAYLGDRYSGGIIGPYSPVAQY